MGRESKKNNGSLDLADVVKMHGALPIHKEILCGSALPSGI